MEFNLIGYENGKEVKVPIPFDEIVKQFWPYHNAPSKVAVSTSYYIRVVFIDRSPAECYNKFRMLWIGMYHLPQRRF